MDIIIKNMAMPKNCHDCKNGWCNLWEKNKNMTTGRHPDCPLAELPEHKKAYWKNAMCSNCGAVRLVSASGNFYYVNYCHNCGAEIVEANNGTDIILTGTNRRLQA